MVLVHSQKSSSGAELEPSSPSCPTGFSLQEMMVVLIPSLTAEVMLRGICSFASRHTFPLSPGRYHLLQHWIGCGFHEPWLSCDPLIKLHILCPAPMFMVFDWLRELFDDAHSAIRTLTAQRPEVCLCCHIGHLYRGLDIKTDLPS